MESTTSTELSEDPISHIPTEATEDLTPIETPQVPTASITSTHNEAELTENYTKHTFQAPCCCFESGLTIDLLLFQTINVSID